MSDLEARIAKVLGAHTWQSVDIQGRIECHCGQSGITGDHDAHQAAMLSPLVREREAEVWDEALETMNPADAYYEGIYPVNPYRSNR